jgi:hypothetical protein
MHHLLQRFKRWPMERWLAWLAGIAAIGSFLVQIIVLLLQIRGN